MSSYDFKWWAAAPAPVDVLPGSDDRVTRITQLAGVTKDPAGSSSAFPPTLTEHQPSRAGAHQQPAPVLSLVNVEDETKTCAFPMKLLDNEVSFRPI